MKQARSLLLVRLNPASLDVQCRADLSSCGGRARVSRRRRYLCGGIIVTNMANMGKRHTSWSLVEAVRTPDGPRQRTRCHLGELNGSSQARWSRHAFLSADRTFEIGAHPPPKLLTSHKSQKG
jgi:hypothetical protein